MPLARKMVFAAHPCPVCEGRVRGHATLGYTCTRCGAHYTAAQITWLVKAHLRTQIDRHFGEKKLEQVTVIQKEQPPTTPNEEQAEDLTLLQDLTPSLPEHAIISYNPDEKKLAMVINETHDMTHHTSAHLEELLGAQAEVREQLHESKEVLRKQKEHIKHEILIAKRADKKRRAQEQKKRVQEKKKQLQKKKKEQEQKKKELEKQKQQKIQEQQKKRKETVQKKRLRKKPTAQRKKKKTLLQRTSHKRKTHKKKKNTRQQRR